MKKIVLLGLLAWCLPWTLAAQSVDDDLYFVPTKKEKKIEKKEERPAQAMVPAEEVVIQSNQPIEATVQDGKLAIVVKDRHGNTRDVDEYNRRYTSKANTFSVYNDTLYVEEKAVPDPEGEWVNGFDGSADDYEYATRIIRFRNPRYAISISSPLYWDVVYGLNSWDWNVYTDGLYAYAFPTFTNPLWWDWRYGSLGWSWGYPYFGWSWGGWHSSFYFGWGWYGGWGPAWAWHYHYPYYPGWGWHHPGHPHWAYNTYTHRGAPVRSSYRSTPSVGRGSSMIQGGGGSLRRSDALRTGSSSSYRRGSGATGTSSARRVVGSRTNSSRGSAVSTRTGSSVSGSRRNAYTRPTGSGVRANGSERRGTGSTYYSGGGLRSSGGRATYNRGSSTSNQRTYSTQQRNSNRNSYSTPSRSSSSRSSYSGGGGSSYRSSGGSMRSSGGSSRRR